MNGEVRRRAAWTDAAIRGADSRRLEADLASSHPGPGAPICRAAGHIARSDETLEVEIVRCLPGALAVVRAPAGTEEVGLTLVDAHEGDRVLVHEGEAIAVL